MKWGCDIEEVRPADLIRELALGHKDNRTLQLMAEKPAQGYFLTGTLGHGASNHGPKPIRLQLRR